MKQSVYTLLILSLALFVSCSLINNNNEKWALRTPKGIQEQTMDIDTMNLRNPFIFLDKKNLVYYMTGDGGYIWTSKNMRQWCGPYAILELDPTMWMGENPQIESPEIHKHNNRYYYTATFSRPDVIIGREGERDIIRRSCHIFVADSIQGPYKPICKESIFDSYKALQGATFCTDENNFGYLIYSQDWRQQGQDKVQITMLSENLDTQIGEPFIMFAASTREWTEGQQSNTRAIDGPFLFATEGDMLGILFAAEHNGSGAVGVAYSKKQQGLNGPWNIEPEPLLTGGYGQAMLFNDFDGTLLMVLHKETEINSEKKYIPQIFEVDNQYEKLIIKTIINPNL